MPPQASTATAGLPRLWHRLEVSPHSPADCVPPACEIVDLHATDLQTYQLQEQPITWHGAFGKSLVTRKSPQSRIDCKVLSRTILACSEGGGQQTGCLSSQRYQNPACCPRWIRGAGAAQGAGRQAGRCGQPIPFRGGHAARRVSAAGAVLTFDTY